MHRLLLSRGAEKFLAQVQTKSPRLFRRFMIALEEIAENPYEAKALSGRLKGHRSYRLGSYRILYEIESAESVIYIEKIQHRKDVYK